MWRRHPSYFPMVESAWKGGLGGNETLGQLSEHLGSLGQSLSQWDKSTFGSVRKRLVQLRKELEQLRSQSIGSGPTRDETTSDGRNI